MADDIDDLGDQLQGLKEDSQAITAEIVDLDLQSGGEETEIEVTCRLPSGTSFSEVYPMPDAWSYDEPIFSLLDFYDLEPQDVGDLVGREVPAVSTDDDPTIPIDFLADMNRESAGFEYPSS